MPETQFESAYEELKKLRDRLDDPFWDVVMGRTNGTGRITVPKEVAGKIPDGTKFRGTYTDINGEMSLFFRPKKVAPAPVVSTQI